MMLLVYSHVVSLLLLPLMVIAVYRRSVARPVIIAERMHKVQRASPR